MENFDFTYQLTDRKKALADFYIKKYLTDDDYKGDIYSDIERYKKTIENDPNDRGIAWTYYSLACCLYEIKDFQLAKTYFQKSAEQKSIMSEDAYFALSCLKIRLNENADNDL